MDATKFRKFLKDRGACEAAVRWSSGKSWDEVYNTCDRGDWLMWLFEKTNHSLLDEILKCKVAGEVVNTLRDYLIRNESIVAVDTAMNIEAELSSSKNPQRLFDIRIAANQVSLEVASGKSKFSYPAEAAYLATYNGLGVNVNNHAKSDSIMCVNLACYYIEELGDSEQAKKDSQIKSADIFRKHISIETFNIK